MSKHLLLAFSGSRTISHLIEKMSTRVTELQITLFEPEQCEIVQEAANHTRIEMSVLTPRVEFKISDDERHLTQADFIIIAGLELEFKNDSEFVKIVDKLMRKYLTSPIKDDCFILINGSFRGLLTAKIIGEILPGAKDYILVLDPVTFSGSRLIGHNPDDGILYSTQRKTAFIAGSTVSPGTKSKIQELIAAISKTHFEALEDKMLADAVQLILEENYDGIGLSGRFPDEDETKFYGIDDSVPVFLPTSKETQLQIKESVKTLHSEMKALFSPTS